MSGRGKVGTRQQWAQANREMRVMREAVEAERAAEKAAGLAVKNVRRAAQRQAMVEWWENATVGDKVAGLTVASKAVKSLRTTDGRKWTRRELTGCTDREYDRIVKETS